MGSWLEAAILHDYLYVAWQATPGREPREEERRFADEITREARVGAGRIRVIHLPF